MKKLMMFLFSIFTTLLLLFCSACQSTTAKVENFYNLVNQSKTCLDEVADDIYSNWYNAIYNDKFYGSIDIAIASALSNNSENLAVIEANDPLIKESYKEVRNSDYDTEVKAVLMAYSDYYEFVVNVSGSFKSFSENKEILKKELASALKDLSLEI